MKQKTIKDYSISKEDFVLEYDEKYKLYKTQFSNWDTLDRYYQSENYISHTDGKRNWFEKVYQAVKEITIKQKWNIIQSYFSKKDIKVLDIGCGTGDFLKYGIDKLHIDGVGVEPNEKANAISKRKGIHVFDSIENITNETFDVITLWHVLEHVPNLENYFSFLSNHLKEDGVLIIAVPNFNSYDAKHYGPFWAAWDVPRHLWHFSKESLSLLLKPYHFKMVKTEPMYFDSYYVSLLSEEYKTGSKNLIRAVRTGFVSNWKARTSNEYSSLIYIFIKSR